MKIIQGLNGENIDVVLPQLWGVETGSWDESMASSIPKIRNRLNLFLMAYGVLLVIRGK